MEFDKPREVVEFYHLAHGSNCKDAMTFSQLHMRKMVHSENVTTFYEAALSYDIYELKETCLQVFSQNTSEVLRSSEFLNAQITTVEKLFSLEEASISSEMDYVTALEHYVAHNKAKDSKIEQKVRLALLSIRFLTLTPAQIAQMSLLTAEEVRQIIICSSADSPGLARMPLGFATRQEQRNAVSLSRYTRNGNRNGYQWSNEALFGRLSIL